MLGLWEVGKVRTVVFPAVAVVARHCVVPDVFFWYECRINLHLLLGGESEKPLCLLEDAVC